MARKTLTDRQIAAIRPTDRRQTIADPELAGLYVRITPAGARSFAAVCRAPSGRQVWTTLGRCDHLGIAEARAQARTVIARVTAGLPAVEVPERALTEVAEQWLVRHVEGRGCRTAAEMERVLRRDVLPVLGDKPIDRIKRSDVSQLLDRLEDDRGARSADVALTVLRSLMNWHAARSDAYVPPISRGMRRDTAPPRDRVLTDDELRAVWRATEPAGAFHALVRLCLLSAQRRSCVASMRWSDLDGATWRLPQEDRAKGNAGELQLPALAMAVIEAQPRIEGNDFVLAGRGDGPASNFGKAKRRLDERSGVVGWTLHDLRRTARSLMARAGTPDHVAERVLGHQAGGVESIYNRHGYYIEKSRALQELASLVQRLTMGDQDLRRQA